MKRTIVKNTFLLFSFVSLIALASCEKDNPHGGGKDPESGVCNTYGTFTRIMCGESIYDNYWIRTDDGRYLQPCATDIATLCPLPITEGTRVKFGYKKIFGKTACDDMVTCQAYDERRAGSIKVRITCIEIVNQQPDTLECNTVGTILQNDSCNLKTIIDDQGNLIEPQNQVSLAPYANGERVAFGYIGVATLVVPCSGGMGAVVNCIRPIRNK